MLDQKRLFSLCHPLVDIQATVDVQFLKKYGLESDNQILADNCHLPIYEDLAKNYPVKFIPGGCTLNTIRVAQWMLGDQGRTFFSGSIGNDRYADLLIKKVEDAGVDAIFYTSDDEPTGTCASLISGRGNRSLVTNLAAAKSYDKKHIMRDDVWSMVKDASIFYFAGYFLTTSDGVHAMSTIAEYSHKSNQTFAFNLSATYICQCFDELDGILPYCDFIFGNEDEATSFATKKKWKTSGITDIAIQIAKMRKKSYKKIRYVIITQGAKPTIVADSNGNVQSFKVQKVDKITDTNGAGDAFVGGFFSAYMQDKEIPDCIHAGHWAARIIIQHNGCTYPSICDYDSAESS